MKLGGKRLTNLASETFTAYNKPYKFCIWILLFKAY